MDPIRNPGNANLYDYAHNNPAGLLDPGGRQPTDANNSNILPESFASLEDYRQAISIATGYNFSTDEADEFARNPSIRTSDIGPLPQRQSRAGLLSSPEESSSPNDAALEGEYSLYGPYADRYHYDVDDPPESIASRQELQHVGSEVHASDNLQFYTELPSMIPACPPSDGYVGRGPNCEFVQLYAGAPSGLGPSIDLGFGAARVSDPTGSGEAAFLAGRLELGQNDELGVGARGRLSGLVFTTGGTSTFDLDVSLLDASAEARLGENSAGLGAGVTYASAAVSIGDISSSEQDLRVRGGLVMGIGMAGRLHWGDSDQDHRQEIGLGADFDFITFDIRIELFRDSRPRFRMTNGTMRAIP